MAAAARRSEWERTAWPACGLEQEGALGVGGCSPDGDLHVFNLAEGRVPTRKRAEGRDGFRNGERAGRDPVSYTPLTLPTIYLGDVLGGVGPATKQHLRQILS